MSDSRELVPVVEWDTAIAAAGDDVARLASVDRIAGYVSRYGQSHQERIYASLAKLRVARQGGRALIAMAERGERATTGDNQWSSRGATTTLADLGLNANRSARWQAVANLSQAAYESREAAVKGEGEDDSLAAQTMGGLKASGIVEWYTPAVYIEAAREVMGGIDLDPASSELANRTVGAARIYTRDDDGLTHDWTGRVWLNPPYGKGSGLFTSKLVTEYEAGRVEAAVLLLNAYGFDSDWFQPLWAQPICFTDHRIRFTSPQRESGGPANGNILVYLGQDERRFAEVFREFGPVVREWDWSAA